MVMLFLYREKVYEFNTFSFYIYTIYGFIDIKVNI